MHGFPSSYTDSGNTSLGPCLNNNGFCLLDNAVQLLNPGQPFPANFGGTFPEEFFYWAGEATMTVNGGGTALLVMALEGSFAGGVPLAGDQVVFGRMRLRIDNLQVGSTYRCITPYGTFDLPALVAGRRGINFTQDIGIDTPPPPFTTALNSGIGPFLRWDSGLPIVDIDGNQYLGDPNIEHTVTGSPTGTNFFRIEGPNIGGPGIDAVQTDLFAIMGMMVTAAPGGGGPGAPVANFAADPTSGTAPLNVAFTNQSTGTISTFAWDFGDGGTSNVASPSHTYTTAGTFTVSLTVTGPGGTNTRTAANLITVTGVNAPVANFAADPTSGFAPLAVAFTNQSTGTIDTFAWDFGDGGTSNAASPSHTYTTAGTFTVSLTVTGPGGSDTRTATNLITVNAAPTFAIASITPGVAGRKNRITVTDCTPGADVFVLWSTTAGSASVRLRGCNLLTDLASPEILFADRARNGTTMSKDVSIGNALRGVTVRLQAVDTGRCAKSAVFVERF